MPLAGEITERVLSGKGIIRHSDGNYYFGQRRDAPTEYISRVVKFLHRLKVEIDQYYLHQRHTNYEDLYYIASQIFESESGDHDNPAVQPLIEKISPEVQPLLIGKENETREKWRLIEMAAEATNYIRDVVWHLLGKEPIRIDYLDSLKDACLDEQLSNRDIFTLNYDTVLEKSFLKNHIKFNDGFGNPINNVRYWDQDLLESRSSRVNLFKLHGSVNWFRFRPYEGDWRNESIGIPLNWDFWHTLNPAGQMQCPVEGRPMFLAGTFNKILQYTSSIYGELHFQFRRSLRNSHRLVICGYGFGDKGINTQIVEWVYSSPDHRIVLIHPEPERPMDTARESIVNKWEEWIRLNKLVFIPEVIEKTSWQQIRDKLFNS